MARPVVISSPGSPALQLLERLVAGDPPEDAAWDEALRALEQECRLEHAWLLVKQARLDPRPWGTRLARLKVALERSRTRRMSQWQNDPARRCLRLRFAVQGPACAEHPAGLLATLARTLLEAGLEVAMGLEKSPRPAVRLGHPLPLQVEGLGEWADAILRELPEGPEAGLPERINRAAPAGLAILEATLVPTYASPVADLCRHARWRWRCPGEWQPAARERLAAFMASERFEVARTGKAEGRKVPKQVDLRPPVEEAAWDGEDLLLRTRVEPGTALNPRKLLAAILERDPAEVTGLVRLALELDPDPRLLQAERFQPKLRNMFEDAVLLEQGGNVHLVEEDDDEPIRLGGRRNP